MSTAHAGPSRTSGPATRDRASARAREIHIPPARAMPASAYIKSQAHAGWTLIRSRYDDGGYSGGSPRSPSRSPAPSGTVRGFLDSGIKRIDRRPRAGHEVARAQSRIATALPKTPDYSAAECVTSNQGAAQLTSIGTAPGTGILGPETKGRNCRIYANGDRNQSEWRRKTPPIAGLSRQSLQNAKTADWVVGATGIEPVTR
jgi:hypothetical protein